MLAVPYIVRRTWTVFLIFQSLMICIRGDCGQPPVIDHTQPVTETSGVPGATVVYTCDRSSGYYEVPGKSRTITCQDDNTWTSVSEFCARACGDPPRLDYAVPKDADLKDIYLPGTKVSFNCRTGFIRAPSSENFITCLDSYTWSIPSEFCTRRRCGHPGDVAFGEFEASDEFFFGSRVTYSCHEGYHLLSKRPYRDCQADGTWTNAVPQCEAAVCAAPERPVDGSFEPDVSEYHYLDAVSFKCNRGLHLIGAPSASCTSDTSWSASTPTCIAVSCEDPGQISNGRKRSGFAGPYTLNSAVTYECDQTFVMNGSDSITCTKESKWDYAIPKCLTVCENPPKDYGYAVLEEKHIGHRNYFDTTSVGFKCKPGYNTDGSKKNTITCNGRSWSKLAVFCSLKSCDIPETVPNAKISGDTFTFGSKVTYTCDPGYHPTSSISHRDCQEDGRWSAIDLICSGICPDPNVPHSKKVDEKVYLHNDVVTIECIEHQNNQTSHRCNSKRQWEPPLPVCPGQKPSPWGGLTIGAIVGIVIVVILLILGLIVLFIFVYKKKKSGKPKPDTLKVEYAACADA
ncbi:zona pellucida sperm-binding protein 3 receptor-like [Dendropsophus ebraccatus]|uniref:zona pellucida sperm-binding protein 3 receptor-like n=1 Tax=Dendropsophus ebraccatus TaxID=150705 RepID=UPI0038317E1A